MATDEFLWDLMLQQAASGALEFDYLNDEQHANIIQDASDFSHTVSATDSIENNCLFDDLFNFEGDANQSLKTTANSVVNLADIFTEDVAELANGLMFTESFQLTDVNLFSTNDISSLHKEVKTKPSAVASSDHQYGTKDLKSVSTPIAAFNFGPVENITFPDMSPELMNRLLATISNLPESSYDDDDSCGGESSMLTENSANCSEDENMDDTSFEPTKSNSSSKSRSLDRKQRKMQQNRVAAYRYRQKKKAEQDALRSEREAMEKRNGLLKVRIQQMKQEIGYLRSLMTDMMKVRSSSH